MLKPLAFLFSFIVVVVLSLDCCAMGGIKVYPAREVRDSHGTVARVCQGKISIIRAASPSMKPDLYRQLVSAAVLEGTMRTQSPNLTNGSDRVASPSLSERPQTPWQLDFGDSLIPVLREVEIEQKGAKKKSAQDGDERVASSPTLERQVERTIDVKQWEEELKKLGIDLSVAKRITAVCITGNSVASVQTIAALVAPFVGGVERLSIEYKAKE
jgi:hypothetical protein